MGRATNSQQNSAGDVFSMSSFLANWNKVSPEARKALFDRHGPIFSHSMDRIAKMAERVRDGSRVFHNTSGTSRQAALIQMAGTSVIAGQSLLRGNVTEAIYTIGASAAAADMANGFARLMTNPRAVMWLAHNTDKPVGKILGQLQMLRRIGQDTNDPELVELADELEAQFSQ